MRIAVVVGILLIARTASADYCEYHNDYYSPDVSGACTAESTVPEGCPMHVVTPGEPPVAELVRGEQVVESELIDAVVDTIAVPMERIDPFDCFCSRVAGTTSFDRHEVTIAEARDGDVVVFDAGKLLTSSSVIAIGPPGACPEPVWPTQFVIATRCDMCPMPDDDADDDDDGGGGCAAGGNAGVLAIGLVAFGMRRRRSA